jgi:lysozyme family protein
MSGAKSASQPVLRPRFDVAVAALLVTEGGLVDNPSDPGGLTEFGISLRFLVAEGALVANRDLCDVNHDGRIDGHDIRALTSASAAALYRRCFWDAYGLAQLPPPIDAMMLDQCVNMGPRVAIRLLQSAIGGLKLDGRLGPVTDAAVGACVGRIGMAALVASYKTVAKAHYREIIADNPKLAKFGNGWAARVDRLGNV